MRALLVYPKFPQTFWSFDATVDLLGKKALLPPLGLVTVAAMLPEDWDLSLVDRNVRDIREDEWERAQIVLISSMIVQKEDHQSLIREAKSRGKIVVVGGPYPTALPDESREVGADFLVLDEAENTLKPFLHAIDRGESEGLFRSADKPDVTSTPIPRYDLLQLDAYVTMAVQFSRGCPYLCEFCDVIALFGRKPRTKTPGQFLRELETLYRLGWRSNLFVVDDNFIGNKAEVNRLLDELEPWMNDRNHPFSLSTEASIDLSKDDSFMTRMAACNFWTVFVGIESPDEESLRAIRKTQNVRAPIVESIDKIQQHGLQVIGAFVVGFDDEAPGAHQRIVQLVEDADIVVIMFSILQALPLTTLWNRLEKEGRLIDGGAFAGDQARPMNFVPTRPVADISREYLEGIEQVYEPNAYLERAFRHATRKNPPKRQHAHRPADLSLLQALGVMGRLMMTYGLRLPTRRRFWGHLSRILITHRHALAGYLVALVQFEHLRRFKELVRARVANVLDPTQQELGNAPRLETCDVDRVVTPSS